MKSNPGEEFIVQDEVKPDCFVLMPIADPEGYTMGHFQHVYDDIIVPACISAGVNPLRADKVKATNLIHLDILKKLIDSPISICDLSNRNPNVLFELGIRQAFDKPVVLIREIGTPEIFDIGPLRYHQYSREMKYHDVVRFQRELSLAIVETMDAQSESGNINSIVRLMGLADSAKIPDVSKDRENLSLNLILSEIRSVRKRVETIEMRGSAFNNAPSAQLSKSLRNFEARYRNIIDDPIADPQEVFNSLEKLLLELNSTSSREIGDALFLKGLAATVEAEKLRLITESDVIPF